MLRVRVGVIGSSAAGKAMARYYESETLTTETQNELAAYYGAEVEPLTLIDRLSRDVIDGDVTFSEGFAEVMVQAIADLGPDGDLDALEDGLMSCFADACAREEARRDLADEGGTVAALRPDMSSRMAALLGVDRLRPPQQYEIANLLNGNRADGQPIDGRVVAKARLSIAEVFGITDQKPAPPTGEALDHILAGRRVDGEAPRMANGEPVPDRLIAGARKRLLDALHVPSHREPTAEEVARLRAGHAAIDGMMVNESDYSRAVHATRQPVAYAELVFAADKSLSVAWALAPTEAERTLLLRVHTDAVQSVMAFVEQTIGFRQRGAAGRRSWQERGEIGWFSFNHYTARPTAEIATVDKDGVAYTELHEVPTRQPDPHLHSHIIVPSVVLTPDGGVGKINLDRLDGAVHELGGVYQAYIAKYARRHGIEVAPGKVGEARLVAVPERIRTAFSRRGQDAEKAAKEFAREQGLDWDALTPKHRLSLLQRGKDATRQAKREGPSDFATWRSLAETEMGYSHRSVLRPEAIKPELAAQQRHDVAYNTSLPWIEAAFAKRAALPADEIRVLATRGLIVGGIEDPASDIAAVTRAYREQGVRHDGHVVPLVWGNAAPVRGMPKWNVSTDLHEAQERELIALARIAAADKTAALTPEQVEPAVVSFLARNPRIDPTAQQWQAQRAMVDALATGGRLAIGIGAAGSGKTTFLAPLVDAWQADGRHVYGLAVAWRAASALGETGIKADDRASMAAFMKRVESGRYALDRGSVVVVDEVSMVSTRQQLELLRLQAKHGFQIVQIGDEKQCQSIEAGPVIDLMRKALPQTIPEILTTVRQRTMRERAIAGLFREGRAAEALAMKAKDQTAVLVAGGRAATVQRVANLWRERMETNKNDPDFTLTVSTATREDARDVSAAIREQARAMGRVGPDARVVKCEDNAGDRYDMRLAVGDHVRLLRRVYYSHRGMIGNNGDVVEVRDVSTTGVSLRNAEGQEARLEWQALSDGGGPLRIAPGYAATIDSQQGTTSTEHINALVSGSAQIQGFKTYVAESRHRASAWMVINESAERQQVVAGRPRGVWLDIRPEDVWANVARNLSRQPLKLSATEFIRAASDVRRGTVSQRYRGQEAQERRVAPGVAIRHAIEKRRLALSPAVAWIAQRAQAVHETLKPQQQRQHRPRGPRL